MGRASFTFFLCLSAACGCAIGVGPRLAERGRLDLSPVDLDRGDVVSLDGEWELYWGRLLAPDEIDAAAANRTGYFKIPGYWNGHSIAGKTLGGDGCATFRLRIRLPPGDRELAVRIEDESTSYRLWANGTELLRNGVVGPDPASTTPHFRIGTAALPRAQDLDLVLQVANFHAGQGGPYRKIALGTPAAIQGLHLGRFAIDLLLFGSLGVIALLHLAIFALRPRDRSPLHFAGFCLCWSIGTAFGATGGRFVTLLFPQTPCYLLSRTDILMWFASVPLAVMFFRSLYPQEFPVRFVRAVQAVTSVFFLWVLAVPSRWIDPVVVPFQVLSLSAALACCGLLLRALLRRRTGAALILGGFAVFAAAVVNDILFMNLVVYSVYLISAGVFVMVLCQSFALSQRFALSLTAEEALSGELAERNAELAQSYLTLRENLALRRELEERKASELELVEVQRRLNAILDATIPHEGESHPTRRHLGVEVMTCALEYWTQCTGLNKAELATRSGLWKTYTNPDGWERTQTLDRYLDLATFPVRPAWPRVIKTAEFVLAASASDTVVRARLEVLLARLRVWK